MSGRTPTTTHNKVRTLRTKTFLGSFSFDKKLSERGKFECEWRLHRLVKFLSKPHEKHLTLGK